MRNLDRYVRLNSNNNRYEPLIHRRDMLPFWLTFDPVIAPLPISTTGITGNVRPLVIPNPNNSSSAENNQLKTPLEVRNILYAGAGTINTTTILTVLMSNFNGRSYMNAPIHLQTFAGDALLPGVLREPLFLSSNEQLTVQFSQSTAISQKMSLFLSGIQYHPRAFDTYSLSMNPIYNKMIQRLKKFNERAKYVYPFWFTTDTSVTVASGGTATAETKITDNFEAFTISAVVTGTASRDFSMDITEVTSGQTLMNGQISRPGSLGTAQFPTILPFPYILPAGARLRFNFTETTSGGNTATVFVTIAGRKILAPIKDFPKLFKPSPDDIEALGDREQYLTPEVIGAMA